MYSSTGEKVYFSPFCTYDKWLSVVLMVSVMHVCHMRLCSSIYNFFLFVPNTVYTHTTALRKIGCAALLDSKAPIQKKGISSGYCTPDRDSTTANFPGWNLAPMFLPLSCSLLVAAKLRSSRVLRGLWVEDQSQKKKTREDSRARVRLFVLIFNFWRSHLKSKA